MPCGHVGPWPPGLAALLDPDAAWLLWDWVNEWVAASAGTRLDGGGVGGLQRIIEHLRQALEARRDELAEGRFAALVAQGRIEFALRADAQGTTSCRREAELALGSAAPQALLNAAGLPALKSLLEPALVTGDLNGLEADCAGYLDARGRRALVAPQRGGTQYGLQGLEAAQGLPDFVFGLTQRGKGQRLLLLETKGAHLPGNEDTGWARLFARLERPLRTQERGELADAEDKTLLNCKLLMDAAWQGGLEHCWRPTQRAA